MNCPTCTYMMHKFDDLTCAFWCPRCGTVHGLWGGRTTCIPMLVGMLKEFEGVKLSDDALWEWDKLKISEAIGTEK